MPDSITTLALATGGAFLGKFVGPVAEHYGKLALEQAQQLGAKATILLAQVGREPQPVEPKILIPLVQTASLETDETLFVLWAALLANAADPANQIMVPPAYAELLRQLTPLDAKVLEYLYPKASVRKLSLGDGVLLEPLVGLLNSSYEQVVLSASNLLRLGLCIDASSYGDVRPGPGAAIFMAHIGYKALASTRYGLAFVKAISAPMA